MTFIFQDFEGQSLADLTIVGSLKWVLDASTRNLLWSWALDDDRVKLWCPDLSKELAPEVWTYVKSRMDAVEECPAEVVNALKKPDTYIVGWNEGFDFKVWRQIAVPDHGWPDIRVEQTLDCMAQAQASNLPGSLDFAGRALGLGTKTIGGKAIMKRFADRAQPLPGSPADIARLMTEKGWSREQAIKMAIESWDLYLTYSVQDTELMRDVWKCTRQLDASEWQEYWASERINDRGKLVDLDVARGAVLYREEEAAHIIEQIKEVTDGAITSPTLTKQINEWVFTRLPEDLAETMVKARDEKTGEVTRLTGAKDVMTRLIEDIAVSDTPPDDDVIDLLELLQYGRSSSAVKFQKMLDQEVDGRIFNAYVFNGAGQSGRFSSKNLQEHNLVRDKLPSELDVLDMIAARVEIDKLRHIPLSKKPVDVKRAEEGRTPVSLVLARCIRPTFIAPPKKKIVWGDWSAIEARVNPWLADSREADAAVLQPFRLSDLDKKNNPDVYVLNAEAIFKTPADIIWERYQNGDKEAAGQRQAGKVAVLALGFLGGVGALKAMARGYGMRLTNEEAKVIVDGWRDRNKWARRFGDKCEAAAFSAIRHPMNVYPVGKLKYQYAPDLMGGTLICFLPDMRPIVYPMARISRVEKFDQMVDAITYLKGMGRRSAWSGLFVENPTQGTAASLLRGTLVRLEHEAPDTTILHTHDEVGCEVDDAIASGFASQLNEVMVRGFDWSEGLPLAAEVTTDWYYHK
jgi:DNA polymerase bacteriophage-type